jgi:uncharacterized membrane protein YkoI
MRKTGVIFLILAVVLIGGILFLTVQDSGKDLLTDEEIEQMVLDQYPGEITELVLDRERSAYHATVVTDERVYEMMLDSQSGEVQSIRQTAWIDPNESRSEPEDEEDPNSSEADSDAGEHAMLSHEEVREIALNEFDGIVTELELDEDDGRMLYEIEIENGEAEAEMLIDAYTGQIVMIEIDD